jgi:DNA-binding IclR family transcriptional regulator
MTEAMSEESQVVSTTETTLRVIEALKTEGGRTVEGIADELGLASSTVYKHLYTLKKHSFVVQTGNRYALSLRFLNLGGFARHTRPEYRIAREVLEEMSEADTPHWSVDFSVLNNNRQLTVAFVSEEFDAYPGEYYYLHTVSGGKAMMAELSGERIDEIVDQWGLPALTEHTVSTREELDASLEETRERGYAIASSEWIEGMRGVSKAISYPTGELLGSFAIAGPTYMIEGDVLEHEIPEILSSHVEKVETRLEEELLDSAGSE